MMTRQDKRRYSDVRGCCGWSRSSSGCEPVRVARRAGRHGRRGKTLAPQWATKQCWVELPEANRRAVVRWLAVLASRVLAARLPEVGAAGADLGGLAVKGDGHDRRDRGVAVAASGQQGR
jgi:hypothetical protein